MRNLLTLEGLRVLESIQRNQSFAVAAEELHKVPSSLTYTVQKLESDLDIKIFDRSGHRATLTEAGSYLLEQGRKLLLQSQQIATTAKSIARGWESEINFAIDTIFGVETCFEKIKKFHKQFPSINLNISEECMTGTWEALTDQRADLILATSHQQIPSQYELYELNDIEFLFCVARNHPFASSKKIITSDMLHEETIVIVRDSARYMPQRTIGFDQPSKVISFERMSDKINAQVNNLGVGFLPKHRIQNELKTKTLIAKKVALPRPPVKTYLAWRKDHIGEGLKNLISLWRVTVKN